MREFREGDILRHFKKETVDQDSMQYLYQYVGIAIHSESREKFVVYRALYGDEELFIRPYEMFMEEMDHNKYPNIRQKYRFERETSKSNIG